MTEKKKGIVMEADSGAVIVLTSQGEFLSVPWRKTVPPEVGSEIEFVWPLRKNVFWQQRTFFALAASLVFLILAVPFFYGLLAPNTDQVVAFVSVDINPSIEFGINELGIVLEAEALNEDGKRVLENFQPINMDITEAVEALANEAVNLGYLDTAKENNVVIAVSNPEKVPEKVKMLDHKIKDTLQKENIQSEASLIEVTGEIHDKAKSLGVSSGKYVILMIAAEEENLDISLDDIKKDSIVKAVKAAGGKPGQVIAKARENKSNLREIQNRFEEKLNNEKRQGRGSVIANGLQREKRMEESNKKPGPGESRNNLETENSRKWQEEQEKHPSGEKEQERLKNREQEKDQEPERENLKDREKNKAQEREFNKGREKDQEINKDEDSNKDQDRDREKDSNTDSSEEMDKKDKNGRDRGIGKERDKEQERDDEKGSGDAPAQIEEDGASTGQDNESGNTGNGKKTSQGQKSKSALRGNGKNPSERGSNSFIRFITKFFH